MRYNLITTQEELIQASKGPTPYYATYEHKLGYNEFRKVILGIHDRFLAIYSQKQTSRSQQAIAECLECDKDQDVNQEVSQGALLTTKKDLLHLFSLETCYLSLKDPSQVKEHKSCIEIWEPSGEENSFFTKDHKKAKKLYDMLMSYGIGTNYFKYFRNVQMVDHYEKFNIYLAHECDFKRKKYVKLYSKTKLTDMDTINIIKEVFLFKNAKR